MTLSIEKEEETTVALSSTGELQWTVPGAPATIMNGDLTQRSTFLTTVCSLLEECEGAQARVSVPRSVDLHTWLDFVVAKEGEHDMDTVHADAESLLRVLLVADFLGDDKGIATASSMLAGLMVKDEAEMQTEVVKCTVASSEPTGVVFSPSRSLRNMGTRLMQTFHGHRRELPSQGSGCSQRGPLQHKSQQIPYGAMSRPRGSNRGLSSTNLASQVRDALPTHLVAALIEATSDCLHSCLMILPEAFHSLVTEVHHPHIPPSQIVHIVSTQLESSRSYSSTWRAPRRDSEGNLKLLGICQEAVETRQVHTSLVHSSFDDGSYITLERSPGKHCSQYRTSSIDGGFRNIREHTPGHQHSQQSMVRSTDRKNAASASSRTPWSNHQQSRTLPEGSTEDSSEVSGIVQFDQAVCCLSVGKTAASPRCPAASEVSNLLPHLPNLTSLEFRTSSPQNVCRNPFALQALGTLQLCTGLQSLNISGVCCEDECKTASPLVSALLQMEQLRNLALTDQAVTSQSLSDLQEMISDPGTAFLPHLTSLNLSRNRLWYLGVYPLHSLLTRLTTLEEIDLSASLLGIEIFGRYALSDAFRELGSLRNIKMSSNRLHGEVFRPLARAWSTLSDVEHLGLRYSCSRYCTEMALSLSCFTRLKYLDLSGATMNDVSSWSIIASALAPLSSLCHLCLQNSGLSSASMNICVMAIASCSKLTALDLSDNDLVGSEGIRSLANHLNSFSMLAKLSLSGLDSTGSGAKALTLAIPGLKQLKRLDLAGMLTTEEAAGALQDVARTRVANFVQPSVFDYYSIGDSYLPVA